MSGDTSLLEVRDLAKSFPIRTGGVFSREAARLTAVDGVSFSIRAGETLGLVGESGCGKSTTGKMVMRLIDPTSGIIRYQGQDIQTLKYQELRWLRQEVQMVFQDPYSSLNPRRTIAEIIAYPLEISGKYRGKTLRDRVLELLEQVGMDPNHANRYPHQFSGGQRQRIGIARALALSPKLIVLDEPVSALDLSIQAQIINLLQDLQRDLGLAYLFISHDLNVVEYLSDRVAVMYLGKIVELANSDDLFQQPQHPYTRDLLSAALSERVRGEQALLQGEIPSPIRIPSGCRFRTRCRKAVGQCTAEIPALGETSETAPGHRVACHFPEDA
ncbi:oligopeptide/dipeptide ABC transporter ATP-binding protein [Rhodospirillaceae bacterium SYSU D60014]|uniref:ABC transporter ATP-binding protein n=1 Tax=Virgifigura deserti TaxID=2268457 RepID=UPI000E674962